MVQQAYPENRFAAFVDCELAWSGQRPDPLAERTKNYAGRRGCLDKSKRALAGVPWALFEQESPAEDENLELCAQEHKPAEKAEEQAEAVPLPPALGEATAEEEASGAAAPAAAADLGPVSAGSDWFGYLGLAE